MQTFWGRLQAISPTAQNAFIGASVTALVTCGASYVLTSRSESREAQAKREKQRSERRQAAKEAKLNYTGKARRAMDYFELHERNLRQKQAYPEALFFPDKRADETRRYMFELADYWRELKDDYKAGKLPSSSASAPAPKQGLGTSLTGAEEPESDFFTGHWVELGCHYRELVEPVDSFNWYWRGKHVGNDKKPGTHYVDGIDSFSDEFEIDNKKRPGTYQFLQHLEGERKGRENVRSSLQKGYKYKVVFGNDPIPASWETCRKRLQAGSPARPA